MFIERYLHTACAISVGIRSDLPPHIQEVAAKLTPNGVCKSFNPPPEDILSELDLVLQNQDIRVSGLKKELGITRADIMIYFASFVDVHKLPEVNKFSEFTPLAIRVIEQIEQVAKKWRRSLSVGEQLRIALGETKNDLTRAVLVLAIGTRAMARGVDNRVLVNTKIDRRRMEDWKAYIKPFGFAEGLLEDPAGDTYHFWHGVLAGMSRQEEVDPIGIRFFKQLVCDLIYENTALATELLRHKVCRKDGKTHEMVDRVGYEVGRAFMALKN